MSENRLSNVPRIASWCIVAVMLAISIARGFHEAQQQQQLAPDSAVGVEIHKPVPMRETFAETKPKQ